MQKSSRSVRALRGAATALFATTVALFSHVVAGGQLPSLLGIMLPLSISVLVCTLLSGRRFSILRLSGAVAFSQLFFHSLFSMGTAQSASTSMATQHDHLLPVSLGASAGALDTTHVDHGGMMLLAHVLAGLATMFVLHRGESLLFSLTGLVDLFFLNLLGFLSTPFRPRVTSRRPLTRWMEPLRFISAVYVNCVARRGPPALSLL